MSKRRQELSAEVLARRRALRAMPPVAASAELATALARFATLSGSLGNLGTFALASGRELVERALGSRIEAETMRADGTRIRAAARIFIELAGLLEQVGDRLEIAAACRTDAAPTGAPGRADR
jgi:hypothetical protein